MKAEKHTILIADGDKKWLESIQESKEAKKYHILVALTGRECLKKLQELQPSLLIVNMMLPQNHAIEILKIVHEIPLMKKVGVIITCHNAVIQNYHIALQLGASFFLQHPFSNAKLFQSIKRFFDGTLTPEPFHEKPQLTTEGHLEPRNPKSYIKFLGTRGSSPVAGAEFIRYGGNTCCLEIRSGEDVIIIDAGTGIRLLSKSAPAKNDTYHIFFSHTHWDHLLGFPFFPPIYNNRSLIHLWAPVGFDKTSKQLFSEMLAYSYFPVALDDIKSSIIFEDLRDAQTVRIGSIEIQTHYAFHPGSSLCFKVHVAGKTIGYVTDNEFLMGNHNDKITSKQLKELARPYESLIHFFKGCDILIHEAQYSAYEYRQKTSWGHSSVVNAAHLIKLTQAKEWIITHHDPAHSDSELLLHGQRASILMQKMKYPCQVRMAYDGMLYSLE